MNEQPAPVRLESLPQNVRPERRGIGFYGSMLHASVLYGTKLFNALLQIAKRFGRKRSDRNRRCSTVLLTGVFYSENWITAHLQPLSVSKNCSKVWMVATAPVPNLEKVEGIYPPNWLITAIGSIGARLLTFGWIALRRKPDVVGGFHLLFNSLAAVFFGSLTGARTAYICCGGAQEVLGGGIDSDNRLFGRLRQADARIEAELLKSVAAFDIVIARGRASIDFFRNRGIESSYHILPGGIDSARFRHPTTESLASDVITVGRLSPVKRFDTFLRAIEVVKKSFPTVRATIVGQGPLLSELQELALELGLDQNVTFAGAQPEVGKWLRSSRVFALTSDSEGLSLAMLEAMMSGLPVVVSDVGCLSDVVQHGANGFLISNRTPEAFASAIVELLADENRRAGFAVAAQKTVEEMDVYAIGRRWDQILENPERSGAIAQML